MPVVIVEPNHSGIVHCIVDTECSRAVITHRRIISDGLVEFVLFAVWVFEFGNPLGTSTIEDEFDLIAVGLSELLCCLETIDDTAQISMPICSRRSTSTGIQPKTAFASTPQRFRMTGGSEMRLSRSIRARFR